MKHIVIIGNGIAGTTAARHIRKNSDYDITLISAESKHFWSRTALMYIYMGHMKYHHTKPYEDRFWKKNRINLIHDYVEKIDTKQKQVTLASSPPLRYDVLIIATGAKPNKFGWPGQELEGVTGMVSLQDLDRIERYTQGIARGVVVGGGLIGIELSEMLHSRNIPVTFLVREKQFWNNVLPEQEASMISRHIREHHIDLKLETELKEILPDKNGRVRAVVTNTGEEIACQFVGLTAGVHPNTDLVKSTAIETNRGVLVNEFLETNIPDVYAIGDCAERRKAIAGRTAIEQVWYTGRMMGETVAQTICGNKIAYHPGPWFNSAKFFDIEYQTYGNVKPQLGANEDEFYWEHSSGKLAMHFVFDKNEQTFFGINTFGIRLKHECFDQWLKEKVDIGHIISHLREANFDPEFFKNHEKDVIQAFSGQYPEIRVASRQRRKTLGIF
ncbi:Nitrite reductase [NAD(P)H] subunit [Fulvivirga imtechensis AK7]|uniref:Nitrite reductase [NAD(P)H] subunit n=1 Tax=Fulvivirga imtechensis AK7 TaxID=1237149 RepID=L8JR08_9BACT|nr:FAD-dependent oxidoreductase [Fulvivirga imtechensis]ELR71285.1 Nitrite reductase [NAD(P)H] subunit [Fulvivirga imtechensis AK7]